MSLLLSLLLITVPFTATWTPGDNLQKGFKLYYGEGEKFDHMIDMGNPSFPWKFSGVIDFPSADTTYCFAATAWNEFGESEYSNVVCHAGSDFGIPTPTRTATATPTVAGKPPKKIATFTVKKASLNF